MRTIERVQDKLKERSSRPIPVAHRPVFCSRQCVRAGMRYHPDPIDVDTLLVVATVASPAQWQTFIKDPIDVHRMDCKHGQIVAEPYVVDVATIINNALAKAIRQDTNTSA